MASKRGETNILAAVGLRQVFGRDRAYHRIDELSDDTSHQILESIFRIVRSEKPNYVRASTDKAKNDAQSRLSTAASALRAIISAIGDKLKQKTASAVLDHVIDILPDAEGGLCPPIQLDYLKAFGVLLSYAPRGEHLRQKQWQVYIDFVLDNISESLELETDGDDASFLHQSSAASKFGNTISIRASQSSTGRPQKQTSKGEQVKFVLEELLTALKHLSGFTNAPLMTRSERILETMLHWIELVPRSEETAFEVLNNALPTALTEDVVTAANTFVNISRIIRQRDLWNKKSLVLKDNILATMILCRSTFSTTAWGSSLVSVSCVYQILDIIRSAYEESKEHDKLQIDDLGFAHPARASMLALDEINLSSEALQATINWCTLSVMASMLVGATRTGSLPANNERDEMAPKRRKVNAPIIDLFHTAINPSGKGQLTALQLALFVVHEEDSLPDLVVDLIAHIKLTDMDDDPQSTSWTCLLLARIASIEDERLALRPDSWKRIWLWACGASAASATSRAGCYLLYSLIRSKRIRSHLSNQAISDSIFPDGVSGPANLSDAALLLLSIVLTSGLLDTEKTFKNFVSHALRWLENEWTVSPDRFHNAQIAAFVRSDNLYEFLTAVVGMHITIKLPPQLCLPSAVYKALLVEKQDLTFTKYMLLDSAAPRGRPGSAKLDRAAYVPSTHVINQFRQTIVEVISNKVKLFHMVCKAAAGERATSVSLDMMEVVTTACVLCYTIVRELGSEQEWTAIQPGVNMLWEMVRSFLVIHSKDFMRVFSKVAIRLTSIQVHEAHVQNRIAVNRLELCTSLEGVLQQNSDSQEKLVVLDPEFADSLESRTPQGSQQRASQTVSDVTRSSLAAFNDTQASFARQCLALKLDLARSRAHQDHSLSYSGKAIDAITGLSSDDLLLSREIIINFLDSEAIITRSESYLLLTRLAQACLQQDDLARCETALCLCLDITMRLTPLWATDQDDDLSNVGYDIYRWFVTIALGRGIATQRVLLSIASLLQTVLHCSPSYGSDSLPSARTSLLQILSTSQAGSKFQLLNHLSDLFNGYVLSEHSAVFTDIIDNLPSDPDKREGIVLRLYIISGLGARWHTILRQSIYHIFETAANVPSTVTIAAKCVRNVCEDLSLGSSRQVFRLFSSQVLYTWLETQGVESIAFRAFGYNSLDDLRIDVQDELVAQIAMRGSAEHMQKVVQSSGTSWDSLIERWFAKVVAYAIITDVAIQRSGREIGKVEMSLVQQLGEETYATLCRKTLARAVSTILLRLSDDKGFEKVRDNEGEPYAYVQVYQRICELSSSQTQLPPGQQPSFRAKHLVQILDRMCMRAQENLESVWTPALLVHVYRALLSDAVPAFGPLHTCAVLRKLRLVVCLAGSVALSGYPLQMLLHALRPFITQFHSSEDAFGIFWYLLEHGKAYLKQKIPFVTGLSVTIFASLSKFASSSQDSTTQESHFTSTMSKAQDFRQWLGQYLGTFSVAELDYLAASTYTDIVQAAKQITKAGSSVKATAEGSLLFHLLADQASERPLLYPTFFRLTLRSLCQDFEAAADFHDDILYDDQDTLRIAPVLWSMLDQQGLQDSFLIWILQALGRAYTLQGPAVIETSSRSQHPDTTSQKIDIVVDDSHQSIIAILNDLLWDENGTSASASEATLQSIFSSLPPADKTAVLGTAVDHSMFDELRFVELLCPTASKNSNTECGIDTDATRPAEDSIIWASEIVRRLAEQHDADPVLSFLPSFIDLVPSIAPSLLPHVVHLALYFETEKEQTTREDLTKRFSQVVESTNVFSKHHVQLVLECITHLRKCMLPSEATMAKRNTWLAIDFGTAAAAALRCGMFRKALLLLEIHSSQHTLTTSRSSRRSSLGNLTVVPDLLNQIYRNVDDPDSFYGTHEESDIASIVEKLCHEGLGYKALSFQSALFDSNVRTGGLSFALSTSGGTTVSALNLANLSGLSSSIGSSVASEQQGSVLKHNYQSLLNLHQWDVVQDSTLSDYNTAIVDALRSLSSASQRDSIIFATDQSTLQMAPLVRSNLHQQAQQINYWTSLAALAELKEAVSVDNADDLSSLFQKHSIRRSWTEQESFDCIEPILLNREALFATVKNNSQLRNIMGVTAPQAILLEIQSLRASLNLGHLHEMSQFCLNRAAYLSELLPSAADLGVKVEAAIQYDLANTFWAQHETAASIRILQHLHEQELPDQAILVQQSEILTDLGSKITEARLDRPDEITAKYLIPAIKALGKETMGSKVGRVFHNFAAFCDSQLKDADNVDEYERVEKIRDRKLQEVRELEEMYKKGDSKTRDTVKAHFTKAKTWFKLDDEELRRLKEHRERLVRSCLENYLLSLRACEDFPNDVLRFLALWMEQSTSHPANASVSKHLSSVPTHKFAPLMNQLSSRLLNEENTFQHLLSDLLYHICEDHPFHSLYQIFATSKSKGAQKDEVANSRHTAAFKLSEKVRKQSSAGSLWISIHNSNIQFVRVAQEKFPDKELKTGSKLLLRKLPQGLKLEQTIHDMHHKIPPPTMKVEIRPDKDYLSTPTIARFDPQISIAGGVSAPKIITIVADDGTRHKMLLKGGNDDLRQDSIMEQVFEQVSNLLKDHRPTRQRKLGIRTYKVIPLTHNAGIIEFVRDTMPLHDYVLPAHMRYYPKDYKPNKCRKEIADAQSKPLTQRLQAYRNVVANFHPVMRFFFMEHFLDPDEWFQKRLNYSRSTAAISMLGHVLGLGDRHGHNILLDTKTGEVVHIDLGVAFEAGRVLPVPEVVPFRLTRDLVDGMGLSGVEGVFRRCCNFTLEALRRNQEAIMTILDVLRWDPLYSWSVSPLRLARMQENQEQAANNTNADASATGTSEVGGSVAVAGADPVVVAKRSNVNEPSEADRALAVVSKKLGKSLSVEATVNELIRQAMDERNLAVLYCGWAAYA